jgi:hypothetical protein
MPTSFRPYAPDQSLRLPPSPRDWPGGQETTQVPSLAAERVDALIDRLTATRAAFHEPASRRGWRRWRTATFATFRCA